jgi:hypothetical protein
MSVWAERIEKQVRAAKTAAEREAILVRDDVVKVNLSMCVPSFGVDFMSFVFRFVFCYFASFASLLL